MKMRQSTNFCHLEPLTHVKKMKNGGEPLKERENVNCISEDLLWCEKLDVIITPKERRLCPGLRRQTMK